MQELKDRQIFLHYNQFDNWPDMKVMIIISESKQITIQAQLKMVSKYTSNATLSAINIEL